MSRSQVQCFWNTCGKWFVFGKFSHCGIKKGSCDM